MHVKVGACTLLFIYLFLIIPNWSMDKSNKVVLLPGDHRGPGGVHSADQVPPACVEAQRRPAHQAALRAAEGLLQGRGGPRGELPPSPELLQGICTELQTTAVELVHINIS